MAQTPPVTISMTPAGSADASASLSEKNATLSTANTSTLASASKPKVRSCVVCRTRKVRCDRQSPCSNCRRANIACVFPSTDRPPRWARRLERITKEEASKPKKSQDPDPAAARVVERLRNLENLVKELSGQLEQANAAASSVASGSSGVNSPESSGYDHDTAHQRDASPGTDTGPIRKQFGRLVLQDANRSRYVSSGFWSRVDDELQGLKMDSYGLGASDSDTSDEEASSRKSPSTQELQRTPLDRHAFFFRHNLNSSTPSLDDFRPLPSQIPFLLDVFSDNVNAIVRVVHMPTITKMVHDLRGSDTVSLTPAQEALMFSIYYAAITSMEEEDVLTNFGFSKAELNLKYRLGLEHALAEADFLNVSDLLLVQAFSIFLGLARRHDSPRFVWMMTGLAVRMGQALGLQRDGTHFEHLTPYEIEMRRRLWWVLCTLDTRASEDQGTDYIIVWDSFDTKLPLNVNDADIDPESTQMPVAREGITDMTYPLISCETTRLVKQMMSQGTKEAPLSIEEQSRLLDEIYQQLERGYLQYSIESGNIAYWVAVIVTRLVMAKMTLLIYLPTLFSSPSERFSDEIKTKLLVAAIEVAEYNHALNAEQACRHWRWVYQTYIHWYAIVYLLIEVSRRPWSPIIERAWVALHSQWLIPTHINKTSRVSFPLRRLMARSRKHRDAELERLRGDPQAAKQLEMEDQRMPVPASPGPFVAGSNVVELFRERWHQLLAMPEELLHGLQAAGQSRLDMNNPTARFTYSPQPSINSVSGWNDGGPWPSMTSEPAYLDTSGLHTSQNLQSSTTVNPQATNMPNDFNEFVTGDAAWPTYSAAPASSASWPMGPGFVSWPWADSDSSADAFANMDMSAVDVNMGLDDEVDWYNWVESAKDMEWNSGPNGNQQT